MTPACTQRAHDTGAASGWSWCNPALQQLHIDYVSAREPGVRDRLALHYDGFALALARGLHTRREHREDLDQVARVGLLKALDRFDPERGEPFAAFARITITGELKRHLRDRTWSLRVPRALKDHYLAAVCAADDLTGELGRSPTIPELARRCGLEDDEVLEAMELGRHQRPVSLEHLSRTGAEIDVGCTDTALARVERRELAQALMAALSARDRRVMHMRFHEGLTQAQIAERVGMSQISVSRQIARILERLRVLAGFVPAV